MLFLPYFGDVQNVSSMPIVRTRRVFVKKGAVSHKAMEEREGYKNRRKSANMVKSDLVIQEILPPWTEVFAKEAKKNVPKTANGGRVCLKSCQPQRSATTGKMTTVTASSTMVVDAQTEKPVLVTPANLKRRAREFAKQEPKPVPKKFGLLVRVNSCHRPKFATAKTTIVMVRSTKIYPQVNLARFRERRENAPKGSNFANRDRPFVNHRRNPKRKNVPTAKTTTVMARSMNLPVLANPDKSKIVMEVPRRPKVKENAEVESKHVVPPVVGALVKENNFPKSKFAMAKMMIVTDRSMA